MLNKNKYHFEDFTHAHYTSLLESVAAQYQCSYYNDEIISTRDKIVLWRHDVDFSMHEALNLARLEKQAGVKATYFLLPHSEFYNLLEHSITALVREIIGLGHEIGLHFDPSYYTISSKNELEEKIALEKNLLENIFDVKINVFSFHNPTEAILKFDEWKYAGLINTYAKDIKENITYCSDSNGYWRHSRMADVINNTDTNKLQALTHPEWWTEKIMSPKEKIWRCIDKRAEKNKVFYKDSIEKYNRSVIDWE